MPIGARLMEDYVAPARITPYRLDYEMLVTDRPRTVVSVLQALSCHAAPTTSIRHLAPPTEHTGRNRYDDWYEGALVFCDYCRNERRHIEAHPIHVDDDRRARN